jgi:hypothetical protein
MKGNIRKLVVFVIILVAFGTEAKAQIPKEATTLQTWYYSGTFKALPMGQERLQMNYEMMGVVIGDTSKNIFHNASVHWLGSFHAVKGEFEGTGFGVAVRPDGDQVFFTYKDIGKVGVGTTKGNWTIVGGTGKLAGIQGGGEFTCTDVRPAAEGTFQGYCPDKAHYKLP